MKYRIVWLVIISAMLIMVAGCRRSEEVPQPPDFRRISPEEARARLENEEGVILLDVRTPEEYTEIRIPGSLLIPLQTLEKEAPVQLPDQDAPIFMYCRSGRRSLDAARILVELGYTQVYDLGGIIDWPYETEE